MSVLYGLNARDLHQRQIEQLIEIYGNKVRPEEIKRLYNCALAEYEDASIKVFLPLLIRRKVKNLLLQMIHA